MKQVPFDRTGMAVSQLCLGTMPFGKQCDRDTSFAILDAAVGHGITFIDTADAYPQGASTEERGGTETIIGEWMAERGNREDVILATKFFAPMGHQRWQRGGSRKHIMSAIDASLRRLDTDYVDLYQMHFPDDFTPIEETMSALNDVVRAGKVRYLGVSNFDAWQVARANGIAAAHGWHRVDAVQPRYSLLYRNYERELFPLCALDDIAVIPYNPLAGGLLTGKHSRSADPETGTRFALEGTGPRYRERYWHEVEFDGVDAIAAIAAEAGIGMVELVIAWQLANPVVTSPIVGASKPEQLAASAAALDVTLDDDVIAALNDATDHFRQREHQVAVRLSR